jgi:hypothetical protein
VGERSSIVSAVVVAARTINFELSLSDEANQIM